LHSLNSPNFLQSLYTHIADQCLEGSKDLENSYEIFTSGSLCFGIAFSTYICGSLAARQYHRIFQAFDNENSLPNLTISQKTLNKITSISVVIAIFTFYLFELKKGQISLKDEHIALQLSISWISAATAYIVGISSTAFINESIAASLQGMFEDHPLILHRFDNTQLVINVESYLKRNPIFCPHNQAKKLIFKP